MFTLSLPAPHSPVVNSVQFNDVAFSSSIALSGDIYRSFLLYSAIYFLKVCKNSSVFVRHVWSWPLNSKKLLWGCRGNWSLNTHTVNMYLASAGSEAKIICRTLIFFSKTHWGEKKPKSCYWSMNRSKQTIPLPLLQWPPHTSCLLDSPILFLPPAPNWAAMLPLSSVAYHLLSYARTRVPHSPLPVSVSSDI